MKLRVPDFLVDLRQNFICWFLHTNGLIDTSAANGLQRLISLEELDCGLPVVPEHFSSCKHKTPSSALIFTNYIWRVHMKTKIKAFHLFLPVFTQCSHPVAVPHYCTDFFPSNDIMQLVILVVFLQDYNFQRTTHCRKKMAKQGQCHPSSK